MREDYEPYTIQSNGRTYWCFDVEYYGHYICGSKEELKEEIKRVKKEVAGLVKRIEKQNAAYYKRMAEREDILRQQLKEARERKLRTEQELISHKSKQKSSAEREQIREYIRRGYSNGKILLLMPESSMRTISHVRLWYEKKQTKEQPEKKETKPSIGISWWGSL